MSCMSCHEPKHAFQGNNGSPIAAVAAGSNPDKLGRRKTPTIMYKAYSPAFGFYKDIDDGRETLEAKGGQFWDGRASDLVDQPIVPLLDTGRDEQSVDRSGGAEGASRRLRRA